jgi:hypothetical protein
MVRGHTAVPGTGRRTAIPTASGGRTALGSRNLMRPPPGSSALNQSLRPMTQSGRPITGFLRPGTMVNNATKYVSILSYKSI